MGAQRAAENGPTSNGAKDHEHEMVGMDDDADIVF